MKKKCEFYSRDFEKSGKSLEFFIPYFESYDYLVECLLSLRSQDLANFNVTIVDDGSSDNRAEEFIKGMQDSRFLYVKNKQNLGLTKNFQKCVDLATSDWIIILGQDDQLPIDFVRTLYPHLNDLTLGFIQPRVKVIDFKGNVNKNLADLIKTIIRKCILFFHGGISLRSARRISPSSIMPWFVLGNPFYFPTIVWNRAFIKDFGFRHDLPITLDFELIFRFLNNNFELLFLEDSTAYYRRHEASASGNMSTMIQRLEEETRLTKTLSRDLKNPSPILRSILLIRPIIRSHALVLAFHEIRTKNFSSALRYLKIAFGN